MLLQDARKQRHGQLNTAILYIYPQCLPSLYTSLLRKPHGFLLCAG
jgi:hypothetical protein